MIGPFAVPTKVLLAHGALDSLGALAAPMTDSPVLLVHGRGETERVGHVARARSSLAAAGLEVVNAGGVPPEPRCADAQRIANLATAGGCGVLVAVGGGSVLDAAKAAAIAVGSGRPVAALLGSTVTEPLIRPAVIAVPTVAGSGAEVTRGAILRDDCTGARSGVRGSPVFPIAAVIDPSVLSTVPTVTAAAAAFDAVTHAIEARIARGAGPLTDAMAATAITLVIDHAGAVIDGHGLPADYSALATASVLGGYCVATASTCLPHRLQQAMGAVGHLAHAHGVGLAALYPAWTAMLAEFDPALLDSALSGTELAGRQELFRLASRLGLPGSLSELGFSAEDLDVVAKHVTGNLSNDPLADSAAGQVDELLRRALHPMQ